MIGQCFLYGNGGGAAQYKVYNGTSAPASPREGDIWVKTSVAITYVTFMSYTVATPEWDANEGEVCILAGTDYSESTDADMDHRNNYDMYLYPRACLLYSDGSWVNVDAYVYNSNNQWGQFSYEWNGELFDNGEQYTSVTGGWVGNNQTEIGSTLKLNVANSRPIISTVNAIDLSGYSTLHCIADLQLGKVGVASTKDLTAGEPAWTASTNIKAQEVTVDISSLTTGYIQLFAVASWTATVNISKIWLT